MTPPVARISKAVVLTTLLAAGARARPEPHVPIPSLVEESAGAARAVLDDPMRPISLEEVARSALDHYPDNEVLRNPFGTGTALACEGLMQWLAPRGDGSRWHSGLDLVPRSGRASGRKLYAPGDGIVVKRSDWHRQWGAHLLVVFRKGEKLYLTGWFHLKRGSHRHLPVADPANGVSGRIEKGDLLGRVGNTGHARGAHLHLDVVELPAVVPPARLPRHLWNGRDWSEFVHPADVIEGLPRAVYRNRTRPDHGVMTWTRLPRTSS